MRKFWIALLGLGGVLVLGIVVTVGYVVWDYAREHAAPETGHEAAGSEGYVEVDWIVRQGDRNSKGRRLHLRIPREYKMEIHRSRQTSEEMAYLDHNGIRAIVIHAWLPDMSPNPPERIPQIAETEETRQKVKELLSKRLWVQLRAGGGGTSASAGELTRLRFKKGRMYRRPDFHGLEWYVPMGCGDRLPDIKTPKPSDDLSPEGCRETYGDHEFLSPARGEGGQAWLIA